MAIEVHGSVDAARVVQIAQWAAAHATTERLFRDVDRDRLDYDVIAMDEYTMDIVVVLPGGPFVVYDTT
jgi:hypothetical protein